MNKAQRLLKEVDGYLSPEDVAAFPGGGKANPIDANSTGKPSKSKSQLQVELDQARHDLSQSHNPDRVKALKNKIKSLEDALNGKLDRK